MLPARRKPMKSGIARAPRREWPRHRSWVRKHECVAAMAGVDDCAGEIEFAHVRSAANSGTGLKPHDASGVSCCRFHHAEIHRIGQPAFERKYLLDLANLAAEFAKASPDKMMVEAMRDAG